MALEVADYSNGRLHVTMAVKGCVSVIQSGHRRTIAGSTFLPIRNWTTGFTSTLTQRLAAG
jgi:hypothetical protein